jgi:hypothetical protein
MAYSIVATMPLIVFGPSQISAVTSRCATDGVCMSKAGTPFRGLRLFHPGWRRSGFVGTLLP